MTSITPNPPTGDDKEIAHELLPLLKIYKSGRVERFIGTATVPASLDPLTKVHSSDILISPDTKLTARLYVPTTHGQDEISLPLLLYFHGGGFVIESAASPSYHPYLNSLSAQAHAVILSLDYRLAPEHPLPAAYDDALAALHWLATADPSLLPSFADRTRVFLAGDSAGANIAHRAALLAGLRGGFEGLEIRGIVLVHPFFWGEDEIGSETTLDPKTKVMMGAIWRVARPGTVGSDDPWFNPGKDPDVGRLGCGRVLVLVAEKDALKERGWYYGDVLKGSGWGGTLKVVETKGEGHVFHLFNPESDNAMILMAKICAFVNGSDDV